MLGLALIMMATTPDISEQNILRTIQDRNFYVSGDFCTDAGCETTPRQLGESLQFAGMKDGALDTIEHLKEKWDVRFDCAVSGNRIRACRVVDQPARSDYGVSAARRIIQMVRLRVTNHKEPRAIIEVEFDPSGCPSWMCTATPPAPPPPTSAK